jgi:S-adenosyl methyltransferase
VKQHAARPGIDPRVAFLARTVSYLAGQCGIRQFLDIGAGLPAAPNTRQIAQSIAPQARVVPVMS